MKCRICEFETTQVIDLGVFPPANSLQESKFQNLKEYPLKLEFCSNCHNLQLSDCLSIADLYSNYFYETPNSSTLTSHYTDLTNFLFKNDIIDSNSFVLEIGSNVGHFLEFIRKDVREILGVDPAKNICEIATNNGIPTICSFFNTTFSKAFLESYPSPDLIIARHCLAHNCDVHELIKGIKDITSENTTIIIENAYAINTIEGGEFDQIYHEHMFYFSIKSMSYLLKKHDLELVDSFISLVHGGSIVFVAKKINENNQKSIGLKELESIEDQFLNLETLDLFRKETLNKKSELLKIIRKIKNEGKTIYTYGATAKGNTLLNFLGITDEISKCVDSSSLKIGKFLPKVGIEIISEEELLEQPDYFLLTAWNYKDEIISKVRKKGNYNSKFIIPFPNVQII